MMFREIVDHQVADSAIKKEGGLQSVLMAMFIPRKQQGVGNMCQMERWLDLLAAPQGCQGC